MIGFNTSTLVYGWFKGRDFPLHRILNNIGLVYGVFSLIALCITVACTYPGMI